MLVQGGISPPNVGTFTLFARAQSGLPFTPLVQGDVNGDGRGSDRAFVPDPSRSLGTGADDVALATQLRALLANGSDAARECLTAYAGTVAARNGCRGPWTQSLNVQWRPRLPAKVRNRVTASVYFANVLGGVDQLLHGSDLRGWGSGGAPDPVLLVPRGFDRPPRGARAFATT